MKALGVGAHPDDVEILCAGTLAKFAKRGDEVAILIATDGRVGSPSMSADETARVRRQEAEKSASVIGAELIWLGHPDEFLFNDRDTRLSFIEGIRRAAPDIMFVHSASDYHPDHRIAGQIALDCRIPVSVPLIETESDPCSIPDVFIMDHVGGTGFIPDVYVDITDTMDTKVEMLESHVSQDEWLRHVYGMKYVDFMSDLCRARGAQSGHKFAEGFKRVLDYPASGRQTPLP